MVVRRRKLKCRSGRGFESMLLLLLIVFSLVSFSAVLATYLLYFGLIYRDKRAIERYLAKIEQSGQLLPNSLPKVSVIISTFEEESVIQRRLENIESLDYPHEKIEVIVIDDDSKDRTAEVAQNTLSRLGLNGRVLINSSRIGLNKSLNIAIHQASNDTICVTDADVIFDESALKRAVAVLSGFAEAGGTTGRIVPFFHKKSIASSSEDSYRKYYHQCMLGESAVHSAFPGNGPLVLFNKSVVHSSIPVASGSSDGNIAMNVVKSGLRFLYVPNALIYEPVPETISQQRLQKVRRAKRLIQVFLSNRDVLLNKKYGQFGSKIFPLKFSMHVLCPILMCTGFVSTIVFILLSNSVMLYLLVLLVTSAILLALGFLQPLRRLVFSFVLHQLYLVAGLLSLARKTVFWKRIERK